MAIHEESGLLERQSEEKKKESPNAFVKEREQRVTEQIETVIKDRSRHLNGTDLISE